MKKIKLASIAVDLKKEREGDWIESRANEGVSYLLRSPNSPEYTAAIRKASRAMAMALRDGKEISEDVAFSEEGERACTHLLRGWNGFDVDYTPDVALMILKDPQYRPLLADVMACAERVGRKEIEFIGDDAKN